MKVFKHLNQLREMEKSAFPRALSLVERDVCLLIGLYNERGANVTQKVIRSCNVASQATLERVLLRLVHEGIVHQSVSRSDGRCRELKLDTTIRRKLLHVKFNLMVNDSQLQR